MLGLVWSLLLAKWLSASILHSALQAKAQGFTFDQLVHLLGEGVLLYPYPTPGLLDAANRLYGATAQSLASASGTAHTTPRKPCAHNLHKDAQTQGMMCTACHVADTAFALLFSAASWML